MLHPLEEIKDGDDAMTLSNLPKSSTTNSWMNGAEKTFELLIRELASKFHVVVEEDHHNLQSGHQLGINPQAGNLPWSESAKHEFGSRKHQTCETNKTNCNQIL